MRGFIATLFEDGFGRAIADAIRKPEKATVIPEWMTLSPEWRDWNVATAINEGLRSHWVVWRCFTLKARMQASVPWVVKRPTRSGEVEIVEDPNHPLVKLIHSPNPYQTWTRIQMLDSLYADTAGDFILYHSTAGGDAVWPLRVENVEIKELSLLGREYIYTVGGEPTTYSQDEVVHIQQADIGSRVYGLGTIRAAGKAVDTGNSVQTAQQKSMNQVVRPSGLLSGEMGKDVYEALKADIKANKAGAENVGKLLIARSTLTFQPFMFTPAEVDYINSLGLANDAISAACEVDPCLIGLKDTTYENKRAAEVFMWNTVTIPRMRDSRDTWNLQLVPRLVDDGSYLDYDLMRTPAVVDAIRKNAETAKIFVRDLRIAPRAVNERLNLGFSQEDVSDVVYISATEIPLGGDEDARSDVRMVNLSDGKSIAAFWRAKDGEKRAFERSIAQRFKELFQDEEERVDAAFAAGVYDLDHVVDEGRPAYDRALRAVTLSIAEHFGQAIEDRIPQRTDGLRFAVDTPSVVKFIDEYTGSEIVDILGTTKAEIRSIVSKGLLEDVATDDIARALKGKYRSWYGATPDVAFDSSRAFRIARTEVHSVSGFAQHEAVSQSGALRTKEWVSSLDDRTRDAHLAMNGERRPIDEAYSNGLMYPGDPRGDGSEIINCRCNEIYHTE